MINQNEISTNRRRFLKNCAATLIGISALKNIFFFENSFAIDHSPENNNKTSPVVGIVFGTTPIPGGRAVHESDFTIYNSMIAASFAIGSVNIWNMTKGSILDVAVVRNKKFNANLVSDVEFLHELWITLGSYNGEDVFANSIGNVEWNQSIDKIVVTAKTPHWTWTCGQVQPFEIITEYILGAHVNYIEVTTTIKNPRSNQLYRNLDCTDSNNFPIHLHHISKAKHNGQVLLRNSQYNISVHSDENNNCRNCRDSAILQSIKPGHMRSFINKIIVTNNSIPEIVV